VLITFTVRHFLLFTKVQEGRRGVAQENNEGDMLTVGIFRECGEVGEEVGGGR